MTEKVVAKIAYVFNGMHWALPNPCSSDKNVLNNQQTSTVALSVWVQVTVYERNTTVPTFVKQSSHLFVGKKEWAGKILVLFKPQKRLENKLRIVFFVFI